MLKFVIIVLFCFCPWFQVIHCAEIELDTESLEFLSKVPFNLGKIVDELEKNGTNFRKELFYGSQCFIDIQRIFLGMAAKKLWAFKGRSTNSNKCAINRKKQKFEQQLECQLNAISHKWMEEQGLLCTFLGTNNKLENFIYDFALVVRFAFDLTVFQVRYIVIID